MTEKQGIGTESGNSLKPDWQGEALDRSPFSKIYGEKSGQVKLYQKDDIYFKLLTEKFGQRFLTYRQNWEKRGERKEAGDFPLSLDLALNSSCQLRCLMCPLPHRLGKKNILMAEKMLERLLDEAKEKALPALTFGLASEPLLHPQLARYIKKAAYADIMDIRLGTNGELLNPALIEALLDAGLTRLEISLDALRPETYKTIRQGGNLERLEKNILLFLNKRAKKNQRFPLLRLSFLRLPQNAQEEEGFLKKWGPLADLISLQEFIWFPGSALPKPQKKFTAQWPSCAQSFQRLAVNYDGLAWPCCSWYGEKILNLSLKNMTIADIWQGPQMAALRHNLLAGQPPAACLDCVF